MSNISNLTPAETYANLLLAGSNGQGISTTPQIIQDGLGNSTLMTLATNLINFDRGIGQFQLDGVALTASAATLNNLGNAANAQYVLLAPNALLPSASVLSAGGGLSLTLGAGSVSIAPALLSELAGLQALNTTGIVVRSNLGTYQTVQLTDNNSIAILNADGVAGNPQLSVVNDTTVQRVNSQVNGVFQSSKSQLNFIAGQNTGITINDNPGDNRTDIIITSSSIETFFIKASCQAATTANLNVIYNNGASGVGATLTNNGALAALVVDGYNVNVNDRILIKDQVTTFQNGIYDVTVVGNGGVAWVLTRSIDFNSPTTIQVGDFTNVLNGTININTAWLEVDIVNIVGTDPIQWISFGFGGSVTSVTGTLNEINVVNGTTTPVISISPTYVGQASITTLGTIGAGVWNGTPITVPFGGTGLTTLTTAYGVVCAGTTATGVLQNAGTGAAGQILISNGAGALPTWQNSTTEFTVSVNQVAHGFIVGNIIRCTGTNTYTKAEADSGAHASGVVGIVSIVTDADNFIYQFSGVVTLGGAGLTPGSGYFLDPAVAGGYTAVEPVTVGQISKSVFIALSATTALWLNYPGQTV